jgi:predicted enzyme related to lactoylglutathione lyase
MTIVLGIGSVFFRSADPDALFAWYSLCLGADEGTGPESGRTRHQQLVCSIMDGGHAASSECRDEFSFKLIVDDVGATLRTIAEHGGTVIGETLTAEGWQLGWFIDPEGNKVELWQPRLN